MKSLFIIEILHQELVYDRMQIMKDPDHPYSVVIFVREDHQCQWVLLDALCE